MQGPNACSDVACVGRDGGDTIRVRVYLTEEMLSCIVLWRLLATVHLKYDSENPARTCDSPIHSFMP